MKKSRVIFAVLLVLSMTLSLLTACGGTAETAVSEAPPAVSEPAPAASEEAPAVSEQAPPPESSEEPVPSEVLHEEIFPLEEEVTLTTHYVMPPTLMNMLGDPADMKFFSWLREQTNVKLDINALNLDAVSTIYNLMFASGDYPSFFLSDALNQVPQGPDYAVQEGLLVNLADYDEELYWRYIDRLNQMGFYKNAFTPEGNMYCFHKITDEPPVADGGLQIRQDWLDALGLEAPETIDELTEVLTTFKNNYSMDYSYLLLPDVGDMNLIQAYNTSGGIYIVDGEVKFGPVTDEYFDFLTFLRGWYVDGLVSPDFFSMSENSNARGPKSDYVLNGVVGVWNASAQNMSVYMANAPSPDYAITGIAPPTLEKGDVQHFRRPAVLDIGWCIAPTCEDVEFVLQYIDYWYSDEVSHMASWGIEGEAYELDENGNEYFTDNVIHNPDLGLNQAMQLYGAIRNVSFFEDYSRNFSSFEDYQIEAMQTWSTGDDLYAIPDDVVLTTEQSSEIAAYSTDIDTYIDEYIIKFINGDADLSEFQTDFVPAIYDMGIQYTIDCWQEAYDAKY